MLQPTLKEYSTTDIVGPSDNAKIVTAFSLSTSILFCTTILEVGTANQYGLAGVKEETVTPLQQYVIIKSNTNWEGSVIDSSPDYTATGSYGDAKFDIDCNRGPGPFSAVLDKKSAFGNLTVSLVRNGTVLDTQTTTDSLGGVQISGNCELA